MRGAGGLADLQAELWVNAADRLELTPKFAVDGAGSPT